MRAAFSAAALLALLVLLVLLHGSRRHKHAARQQPTHVHRDVDASTSGMLLEQQTTCPRSEQAALALPRALTPLQPFIVVHDSHVGEQWLLRMLQARSGVRVIVGEERSGRAREAAHEWLSFVTSAAQGRGPRGGNRSTSGANASRAVGLLLTARAARSLNVTARLAAFASSRRLSELPAIAVITLSRRNRLKHALSRYVRSRPSLRQRGGGARGAISVQPASMLKLLEIARNTFTEVLCVGTALAGALGPPGALVPADQQLAHGAAAQLPSVGSHAPAVAQQLLQQSGAAAAQRRVLLRLYYEDLLYANGRTLGAVWRHLRLDHAGDAAAAAAAAAAAPVGKAIPNNLCRALANYEELCTSVRAAAQAQASPWGADLGVTGRSAGGCRCAARPHGLGLVLGGSHHKTGTLLLERILQGFSGVVGLPFEKPHWERCASVQRREDGVCFDEHVTVGKLERHLDGAAALVHIVREPLEVCVSSYQYHLRSTESWLLSPRKELNGKSWQQALRAATTRDGLLLECRRSIRDQIRQQGEVFNATKRRGRVLTLRMEELETSFDASVSRLFRFLLSRASPNVTDGLMPELLSVAARFDATRHRSELDDGHLSPRQRKRELRAILLNDTGMATQLASWRRVTGYDATFAAHCSRYGLDYCQPETGVAQPRASRR